MISLIAAIGKNNEIGANNELMWRLRDDMKLFMDKTMNHVVIMGRKSYESLGSALKNRTNVVITRNKDFHPEDVIVYNSLNDALEHYNKGDEEIFVIGGGEIYKQSLKDADRLYISYVNAAFPEAEVFFPPFDTSLFKVIDEFHHEADDRNEYDFTFKLYERI